MITALPFTLALQGTAAQLATRYPLLPKQHAALVALDKDGIPDEAELQDALAAMLGLLPPSQRSAFVESDDLFDDLDRAAALALGHRPPSASVKASSTTYSWNGSAFVDEETKPATRKGRSQNDILFRRNYPKKTK